jgi:hypothetical protein
LTSLLYGSYPVSVRWDTLVEGMDKMQINTEYNGIISRILLQTLYIPNFIQIYNVSLEMNQWNTWSWPLSYTLTLYTTHSKKKKHTHKTTINIINLRVLRFRKKVRKRGKDCEGRYMENWTNIFVLNMTRLILVLVGSKWILQMTDVSHLNHMQTRSVFLF